MCFVHFDLQMCFSSQRRAIFRHLNVKKWSETVSFFNILTLKCASRHSGVQFFHIATSKSGPLLRCFVHFDLQTRFSPQRRATLSIGDWIGSVGSSKGIFHFFFKKKSLFYWFWVLIFVSGIDSVIDFLVLIFFRFFGGSLFLHGPLKNGLAQAIEFRCLGSFPEHRRMITINLLILILNLAKKSILKNWLFFKKKYQLF